MLLRVVMLSWAGLGLISASAAAKAAGNSAVPIRLEEHDGSKILVVSWPRSAGYQVVSHENDAVIRFDRDVRLREPVLGSIPQLVSWSSTPRSLTLKARSHAAITMAPGSVAITLDPPMASAPALQEPLPASGGARMATSPIGAVLPGLPASLVAVVEAPASRKAGAPSSLASTPAGNKQEPPAPVATPPGPQAVVVAADAGPVSVEASLVSQGTDREAGLLLPFDEHVGAAAFRRDDRLVVVFDSDKPVDLAPVAGDPVYGQALFSILPSGSTLTIPLRACGQALVRRAALGWRVACSGAGQAGRLIEPHPEAGALLLPAARPGRVVVVPDPRFRTSLLVGTVLEDGQAVPFLRRGTSHAILPTLLGVAVEQLSDRLELRPTAAGFLLGVPGSGRAPALAAASGQAGLSRTLDLPAVGDGELLRRYKAALAAAAASPAAERRVARLDAAEAAFGLGQARETDQLARMADEDAPTGPEPGRLALLRAAASVLLDSPDAARLLADPRLGNSDEVSVWRALHVARHNPDDAAAAHVLAHGLPLLQGYPEHLRVQVTGWAAGSLVSGGDQADASLVGHLDGNGRVMLARAMLQERHDQAPAALAALDRVAADPDPAVAGHAVVAATKLRLKLGQINAKQAADRLDSQILNARMAGDELSLRLEVASLNTQAGAWAAALAGVREVARLFPEASDQVGRAAATILEKLASRRSDAASPAAAIERLTLAENNLDLLSDQAAGTRIRLALAARLNELDLPDQAAALIRKAAQQASPGADRARLGLALGQLGLDENDGAGARAALDMTDAPDLPPDLAASRTLLRARAAAEAGDTDTALRLAAPLQGAEVDELRARAFGIRQDWSGEEAALAALVAARLPPAGALDKTGDGLVLRLAGAAARLGDQGALHRLETVWSPRFRDAADLAMLHLLASSSIAGPGDLPRSAAELTAMRMALSGLKPVPDRHGN